jgi:hypothetical protein
MDRKQLIEEGGILAMQIITGMTDLQPWFRSVYQ